MRRTSTLLIAVMAASTMALTASAQTAFYSLDAGTHDTKAEQGAGGPRRAAGGTVELSYSDLNAQMWTDTGLSFNAECRIAVAVVFPKEMVSKYAGAKVKSLKFGWNTNTIQPKATAFVRTELYGEDLATGTKAKLQGGAAGSWKGSWNQINLTTPYTIEPDKDLIIGMSFDAAPVGASETTVATCIYGGAKPGINYIMNCSLPEEEGGNTWFDLYDPATPYPILASATIVDEEGVLMNLCEVEKSYCTPVVMKDTPAAGYLRVANRGTNDITSIELCYTFGERSQTETIDLSSPIAPSNAATLTAPFYALGSGTHTVEVKAVNGEANRLAQPMEYAMVGVPQEVADRYTMRPLVEYFCSENDHNSAKYFEDILVPGLEQHGHEMVIVNQHMNDQFMNKDEEAGNRFDDATTMLIDYVDGDLTQVYMPVMAVNRTAIYNASFGGVPDNPATNIVMPMFADALLYEPALATPTFASVDAAFSLSDDKETINVDMTGHIAQGVLPEGEKLYLTVYLMEDNVFTDSQEKADDEDFLERFPGDTYLQQNVIRATLTPMYGIEVATDGEGNYAMPFSADFFADEWNVDQMSVVGILTRAATNNHLSRNAINTCEVDLGKRPDSVAATVAARRPEAVYNLNGQRVSRPAHGLYIVGGKCCRF